MKRKPTRFAIALSAVNLIVAAGSASAGTGQSSTDVVVMTNLRVANGGVNAARHTADDVQYIYCRAFSQPGSPTQGYCYARDKSWIGAYCTTTDPEMVDTIRSVTSSAFLSFGWSDTGACAFLSVTNGSPYAP